MRAIASYESLFEWPWGLIGRSHSFLTSRCVCAGFLLELRSQVDCTHILSCCGRLDPALEKLTVSVEARFGVISNPLSTRAGGVRTKVARLAQEL